MTAPISFRLLPATVGYVEVGISDKDPSHLTARYYDLRDRAALPRREAAYILRVLADNLEATAAELERLERP